MTIEKYFGDIALELKRQSERLKIGFSTHALSAGENREDIVGNFLKEYLPKAFGIDTGIILSTEGEFSNQADLVIVDHLNNAPLYPTSKNRLWLVESVYSLIEVKTTLSPSELDNAIVKCKRFKRLKRVFQTVPCLPKIQESLFILWGFNGPQPKTLKENIVKCLLNVMVEEQPDFIIIPDSILVSAGCYRRLSKFGMPGSAYQNSILERFPGKSYLEIFEPYEFMVLKENSLLAWLVWLTSWLKGAGPRSAPLEAYLERSGIIGEII